MAGNHGCKTSEKRRTGQREGWYERYACIGIGVEGAATMGACDCCARVCRIHEVACWNTFGTRLDRETQNSFCTSYGTSFSTHAVRKSAGMKLMMFCACRSGSMDRLLYFHSSSLR